MIAEDKRVMTLIANPDDASLKRIAWAFGCAKRDSEQERVLYRILLERVEQLRREREARDAAGETVSNDYEASNQP